MSWCDGCILEESSGLPTGERLVATMGLIQEHNTTNGFNIDQFTYEHILSDTSCWMLCNESKSVKYGVNDQCVYWWLMCLCFIQWWSICLLMIIFLSFISNVYDWCFFNVWIVVFKPDIFVIIETVTDRMNKYPHNRDDLKRGAMRYIYS